MSEQWTNTAYHISQFERLVTHECRVKRGHNDHERSEKISLRWAPGTEILKLMSTGAFILGNTVFKFIFVFFSVFSARTESQDQRVEEGQEAVLRTPCIRSTWLKADRKGFNLFSITLKVLVATIDPQCCRVGEVRAGTTSPMPDHKGFKLQ